MDFYSFLDSDSDSEENEINKINEIESVVVKNCFNNTYFFSFILAVYGFTKKIKFTKKLNDS